LGFRSAFQGRYWVESRKVANRTLSLALNGQGYAQSRPFYAILIADSRPQLDEARRYLTADVQGFEEFDASLPAVPLEAIEPVPPEAGKAPVWSAWEAIRPLPGAGRPRYLLSFFQSSPPPGERSELGLFLLFPAGKGDYVYPLRSVGQLDVRAEKLSFGPDGKPSAGTPRPVEVPWRANLAPAPEEPRKVRGIELTYRLPQPAVGSWDAYRIRILAGQANVRPPLWVDEWSTSDDSDPQAGNRTLKLDLFIKAMVRSIQEHVPLSEHSLLLGRGER
ncbi:MAG TPA: hypothetical protein VEG34_05530, partial [Thermoanaerobaculia bacterium]|nr:hypothetical protein [Thermoanaerobaculia bacterium]